MQDSRNDLTSPWMIDEGGHWRRPAHRAENRVRVAELGWVWAGPSDTPGAPASAVRLCLRPSVVDALAIERAIDWLEGLVSTRQVELLLLNGEGRELETFKTTLEAIERCVAVSSALAEIRIVGFRNDPLDAAEMLALPDLSHAWQQIASRRPLGSAAADAIRFAADDDHGLTCALTWIGDQVCYSHIGREVGFRSDRARTAWPGRPLRELGPYDAAAAELLDDLLRFRKPLIHRVEVDVRRRRDPPDSLVYNRLLTLYPTLTDDRPVAISVMRMSAAAPSH